MRLDPAEMKPVVNRIRRAQGQLDGVVRRLESGEECEEIVNLLAAASRALDRAGFAIVSTGLKECLSAEGGPDELDLEKMQKLFLSLA